MLARAILTLLLALSLSAHADTSPQTIVHLLDYIGVDYPQFVKDGKVSAASEYEEQQEFAGRVVDLLGRLPQNAQRESLIEQAGALKKLIDAKADGAKVAALASSLRWRTIEAYGVIVTPRTAPDPRRGSALYAANCAGCHGVEGRGDGPAAKGLTPAPANFHDRDRMSQRSLYGLYNTITLGVNGTSMQPYSQLSEEERWALAFHVGALAADPAMTAKGAQLWKNGRGKQEVGSMLTLATATDSEIAAKHGADTLAVFSYLKANPSQLHVGSESPVAFTRRVLRESIAAYRAGRGEEAQRLALSAYLEGFELAEASLDAVDRPLRQEIESQLIAQRDLMRRAQPAGEVAALGERIDELLAVSADKLGGQGLSPTAAAISAFFILVREGLEALLVVAAIVAFLTKAGRREALPWVHAGWVGALVLGILTWVAASSLIQISGATRELTEGITALVAAGILLYVGFWLHAKSQAEAWKAFIDQHLVGALEKGTLTALAGLSFLAVYREVFETVLFYQALWQQAGDSTHAVIGGFAAGVGALAVIAWVILRFGLRLPIGPFFAACSALMAVLAIAFTGNGVKALQEADVIAASPIGQFSAPLLGIYPTVQSLLAQMAVLALIVVAYLWMRTGRQRRAATT